MGASVRGIRGGIAAGSPGEAPEYRRPLAKVKSAPVVPWTEALARRGLLEMVMVIAARHHVTVEEICGRDRHSHITAARHALWLAFKVELSPAWSYPAIGAMFGVDHTTVMAGVAKAATRAHVQVPEGRP